MSNKPDIDLTLPSVVADLEGKYRPSRLMLTICFHPDADRIGERASLTIGKGEQQWQLGRKSPAFQPAAADGQQSGHALDDQGISRKALQLNYRDKSLRLARGPSASRCQVNGRELDGELALGPEQLKAGVVLLLAHRVLLLLREVAREDLSDKGHALISTLRGSSPYIQLLRKQIADIAASDVDVLIRGETGTGKELVAVNMAAIPAALAPAALFGSAKGAFTGADTAGVGYFEQAQGGVLFLDEVGDTPPEIQAQLLRALQQREIQCVGGAVRRIDLRVVAATDAPLEAGSDFKAALRHRLGDCEINLQPLRQHPEDIGELLWFFLRDYLEEADVAHLLPGQDSDRLEIATWAELFHTFLGFSWPGNVRQLSNFAHQVALASGKALVLPSGLREQMGQAKDREVAAAESKRRSRDISEAEFLEAMAAASYEPTRAAELLKISRTAVYRRIEASDDLQYASQVSEQDLQSALQECGGDIDKAALKLRVSATGLRARMRSSGRSEK